MRKPSPDVVHCLAHLLGDIVGRADKRDGVAHLLVTDRVTQSLVSVAGLHHVRDHRLVALGVTQVGSRRIEVELTEVEAAEVRHHGELPLDVGVGGR
jgi:hypothetical protein